ncbi:MAG: hypothetical protein AAB361_02290 [Patescibacteria group bacterium]
MFSEKFFNSKENPKGESPEKEEKPVIIIKKSSNAPQEVKEIPSFDSELWGRAYSPDDIYLPDSDEAISFAVASHEVGHLIEEGKNYDADLDNFQAVRSEEQRAWDRGWEYLQKHLGEYYEDNPETSLKIKQSFDKIRDLYMQATDLSKEMYLEPGALDNLTKEEKDILLKERRKKFFSEKGEEFKKITEEIKKEKIGIKPDWDKFTDIVKKTVEDVFEDNER